MKSTFPEIKPWIQYRKTEDGQYIIENKLSFEEDPIKLPSYLVQFMKQLNGKRNPYAIDPSLDRKTVRGILRFLTKHGFLREKNRNRDVGRFAFAVIKYNGKPTRPKVAVFLNRFLLLSWLPILVSGIMFLPEALDSLVYTSEHMYLYGLLLGLVFGIVLHEIGHVVSAQSYNAPVYEIGLKFGVFFQAYTLMDEERIKNRLKKAQVYAAGVEMNFLLAGIFLMLAHALSFDEAKVLLFYAALQNLILAIINVCFCLPLDGMKIIQTLLGADDMIFSLLSTVVCPIITLKEQIQKGALGIANMTCVSFVLASQLVAVIYIIHTIGVLLS